MLRIVKLPLSADAIETAKTRAIEWARNGDMDAAKKTLQPLRDTQAWDEAVRSALFDIISQSHLAHDDVRDILGEIATSHPEHIKVLGNVAGHLSHA